MFDICELKSLLSERNITTEVAIDESFANPIEQKTASDVLKFLILCPQKTNLLKIGLKGDSFTYEFIQPGVRNLLLATDPDVVDFAELIDKDEVNNLLDGKGFVKIVDFHPRYVPKGNTPEYLIADAARTSTKTKETERSNAKDENLVKYLFTNKHTSPLEMCSITVVLQLPICVAVHFLRHRTGKFNQFSQRYSEVDENFGIYNPLLFHGGIRLQSKSNKQSSVFVEAKQDEIESLLKETLELQDLIVKNYHKMLKLGLAKEIARFFLPQNQYTRLVMQFDLNNLIKMLRLRQDSHAQYETQIFANAIAELAKPLFPITFRLFEEENKGMFLTSRDIDHLAKREYPETTSKSDMQSFNNKKRRLNIVIEDKKTMK